MKRKLDKTTGRWVDVKFYGKRVTQVREMHGFDIEELSDKLSIATEGLEEIEDKDIEPSENIIQKLCFITGVLPGWFYQEQIPADEFEIPSMEALERKFGSKEEQVRRYNVRTKIIR